MLEVTAVLGDPVLEKLRIEATRFQRELPETREALGVLKALMMECFELGNALVVYFAQAQTVIGGAVTCADDRL